MTFSVAKTCKTCKACRFVKPCPKFRFSGTNTPQLRERKESGERGLILIITGPSITPQLSGNEVLKQREAPGLFVAVFARACGMVSLELGGGGADEAEHEGL